MQCSARSPGSLQYRTNVRIYWPASNFIQTCGVQLLGVTASIYRNEDSNYTVVALGSSTTVYILLNFLRSTALYLSLMCRALSPI